MNPKDISFQTLMEWSIDDDISRFWCGFEMDWRLRMRPKCASTARRSCKVQFRFTRTSGRLSISTPSGRSPIATDRRSRHVLETFCTLPYTTLDTWDLSSTYFFSVFLDVMSFSIYNKLRMRPKCASTARRSWNVQLRFTSIIHHLIITGQIARHHCLTMKEFILFPGLRRHIFSIILCDFSQFDQSVEWGQIPVRWLYSTGRDAVWYPPRKSYRSRRRSGRKWNASDWNNHLLINRFTLSLLRLIRHEEIWDEIGRFVFFCHAIQYPYRIGTLRTLVGSLSVSNCDVPRLGRLR